MIHFEWMVIDHVDKYGLWFRGTVTGTSYVFWWNPIRVIRGWLADGIYFGLFPMHKNHIRKTF